MEIPTAVFRIADLDFPSLSTGDRQVVTETLTSLKTIVEEALVRAAKKKKILA